MEVRAWGNSICRTSMVTELGICRRCMVRSLKVRLLAMALRMVQQQHRRMEELMQPAAGAFRRSIRHPSPRFWRGLEGPDIC
ncbi:MAG: hypothetical protein DMG78_04970 [Acidobacteria bacterium]|nr:MAG: hypothetical protein DMG78_04970 [Acidobacteriota bacterium]